MGGVGEWLIPADCKSAAERLRRFESYPRHKVTLRYIPAVLAEVRLYNHHPKAHIAQW